MFIITALIATLTALLSSIVALGSAERQGLLTTDDFSLRPLTTFYQPYEVVGFFSCGFAAGPTLTSTDVFTSDEVPIPAATEVAAAIGVPAVASHHSFLLLTEAELSPKALLINLSRLAEKAILQVAVMVNDSLQRHAHVQDKPRVQLSILTWGLLLKR
jgi:hypothetical protein